MTEPSCAIIGEIEPIVDDQPTGPEAYLLDLNEAQTWLEGF
jgi:hypothetical protein